MGCLYKIEFPNGKNYIGISKVSSEHRFLRHSKQAANGSRLAIHNAIRKYGLESCKVKTLVISDDHEYLKELEIKAIIKFNTKSPNGYNCTDGGDGIFGVPELVRKKMSSSAKKRASSAFGKKQLSDATKNMWSDPEKKNKIIIALQRKESRKKQSASLKNKFKNKEEYDKLIKRFRSDERRKKLSESAKKQWIDPEKREKLLLGLRRRKNAIR